MIFRTIIDDSTGATKSIGLLGKSISELKTIFSSIKATGVINTFLNTPTIDESAVEKYNTEIENATANGATMAEKQQIMNTAMEGTNTATAQLIGRTKGAAVETETLAAAQEASTLKARTQAVALKAVSAAGNMITFAFIAKGIELAVKSVDNRIHRAENANKAIEESRSGYENAKTEIESTNSELETTRQKISELESKGVLSFTDQAELEKLRQQNGELEKTLALQEKKKAAGGKVAERFIQRKIRQKNVYIEIRN